MTSLRQRSTRTGIAATAIALLAATVPTGFAAADEAGDCLAAGNVWVVVQDDSGEFEGCATEFATGFDALTSVGVAFEALDGFVSTIGGEPSTPGPEDWWSYWSATPGDDGTLTWESYMVGAADSRPVGGTVEGWRLAHSFDDAPAPSLQAVELPAASPTPAPSATASPSTVPSVTPSPSSTSAPSATASVPGLPSTGV